MVGTCTLEVIHEAVRKMQAAQRQDPEPFAVPFSLSGMKVIVSPERAVPVLKLREDAPVTDAFRREFDAYLLDLFGSRDESVVPRGKAYMFAGNIVMNRADAVALLNTAA